MIKSLTQEYTGSESWIPGLEHVRYERQNNWVLSISFLLPTPSFKKKVLDCAL